MAKNTSPNRLVNEKSPYLLQHAYNPVDWWPWCEEAFEKAKAEDKPIFLSVGYSTCHWCHVMERESFEDQEVADALNQGFISIKLDREERPDIDSVYMQVTQRFTGSGGWPMSVMMDWEKRPFFAGTYFPKLDGKYGMGFMSLLKRLEELWLCDRKRLTGAAEEIMAGLKERDLRKRLSYDRVIRKGYGQLSQRFDPRYGGFGSAPKFPTPHNLMLLLRYDHIHGDQAALEMAEKTLRAIYRGGIRDHIGFGFSRYSTDEKWLAPHFEKMLYDTALLAIAFVEAFQVTQAPFYRLGAEEIFEYIQRDMTSAEGAFYSAEDADSQGEEGRFYVFTKAEVMALLGEADGEAFCRAYDVTEGGNFEGKNILNLIDNEHYEAIEQDAFFKDCRSKLFQYRQQRVRPFRDDKILASWNGLMIYALAYAGRAFGEPSYVQRSKAAADFILENMVDKEGKLLARYRDGETRFSGVAEDYAFVVLGLIELYQASFQVKYLSQSYRLNQVLVDNFWEDGALYQTGKDGEALIARPRELYDGAIPSYNSVSIGNFAKLSKLCDDAQLREKAEAIVHFFGADIERMPSQFSFALCGMMLLNGPERQLVITGDQSAELAKIIHRSYQPFATICLASEELAAAFGHYQGFMGKSGSSAVFLCEGSHCEAPIDDGETLRKRLAK